jgi:hypothetical protein
MQAVRTFLKGYMARHADPWCQALHVVGVPLAPWGAIVLVIFGQFGAAAAALVTGYGLQWIGHRIEGNAMGDWAMFKAVVRWMFRLGRPPVDRTHLGRPRVDRTHAA